MADLWILGVGMLLGGAATIIGGGFVLWFHDRPGRKGGDDA